MMRTDESITARERAELRRALALDDDRITQAVEWSRQAGYERAEIAGVILDAATRRMDGKPGVRPRDKLRAAIFAGSPLDVDRAQRFFEANLARAGAFGGAAPIRLADLAMRRRPRSCREVAIECLADAADRAAVAAGQRTFAGIGWAAPSVEAVEERGPEPEGEPA